MDRCLVIVLFLSMLSFIVTQQKVFHHKTQMDGCPLLANQCNTYCSEKGYCTGVCGTSNSSDLLNTSPTFGLNLLDWCHCYRGEKGCNCNNVVSFYSLGGQVAKKGDICVGDEKKVDLNSRECQQACVRENFCFGTCFDLVEPSGSRSHKTCSCYKGRSGCCSRREKRSLNNFIGNFFGYNSTKNGTESHSNQAPASSDSTPTGATAMAMSTESHHISANESNTSLHETSPGALGAIQGPVYMALKANGSYGALNQSEGQTRGQHEISNTTHHSLVRVCNGSVSVEKDNTSNTLRPLAVIPLVNESGHGVYSHPRPEQSHTSYGNNGNPQPQHEESVHPKYVRSVDQIASEANKTSSRSSGRTLDFDPISVYRNISTGFMRNIEKLVNSTEAPESGLNVTSEAGAESHNITIQPEMSNTTHHSLVKREIISISNGSVTIEKDNNSTGYENGTQVMETTPGNSSSNHGNESEEVFYIVNGTNVTPTRRPGYNGMGAPQRPEYVPLSANRRPNAGPYPGVRPYGNTPNMAQPKAQPAGQPIGQKPYYGRPLQQRPQYPAQQQHTPDCEHLPANHQH